MARARGFPAAEGSSGKSGCQRVPVVEAEGLKEPWKEHRARDRGFLPTVARFWQSGRRTPLSAVTPSPGEACHLSLSRRIGQHEDAQEELF